MPIPFSRYVSITSALGAGSPSPQREFIARLFTTNINIPTKTVLEFTTADEVSNFFGSDTAESQRARSYFGFVSEVATRPNRISFARWANEDTPPIAIGTQTNTTLQEFQGVTSGEFILTLGGITETVTGIDLSSSTDLASVAADIQTVVRTVNLDPLFAQAVVAYDASRSRFTLTGGVTGGNNDINIQSTSATPVLVNLLGWSIGVIFSRGVDEETVTEVLAESTQLTNNFGTYAFVPTLTEEQITESSTWNSGNNVLFQYHLNVFPEDAAQVSGNIINLAGTGISLNLPDLEDEYPEMLPMAAFAATDYRRRASVRSFMYLQGDLTPTVTTKADADFFDALRVNYYGLTQNGGERLAFYQRGFLTGSGTDPINMNVFANEQWLKDFIGSQLISLLLTLPRVPANAGGRGQVLAVIRDAVEVALLNGTISVGRTLTIQERVFVTELSGSETAFQQVENTGFWLDATIESRIDDGVIEFFVAYTLIYTKDNVIRRVEGSHILI